MTQLVAFEQQLLEAQRQNELANATAAMQISTPNATTSSATSTTPTGQQLEHIVES